MDKQYGRAIQTALRTGVEAARVNISSAPVLSASSAIKLIVTGAPSAVVTITSERRRDGGSMNYISQNGTAPIFLRPHDIQSGKNDTAQVR